VTIHSSSMENISTISALVSLSTGLGLFWWRYLFCSGGIISTFNGIPPPSPLDQNRTQIQCKEGGGNFQMIVYLISFSISRFFTALLSYSCAHVYQNISCALININWIRCLILCPNSPIRYFAVANIKYSIVPWTG
jgi:hypothetical protein